MRKKIYILTAVCFLLLSLSPAAHAAGEDIKAREIGQRLVELFTPETMKITISDGGSFAWIEVRGAVIDKMRVDHLRLRAMIKNDGTPIDPNDKYALADQILMSHGELVLLEKDVNGLFSGDIETKGFSNLNFDFRPNGFKAQGLFTAHFIFTIKINLRAEGNLALMHDGIYVENVKIYTEGVQTPDGLVKMVTDRINPLLSFAKIPFPTEFKKITMTDDATILTGYPEPFEGGKSWEWKRPANKRMVTVK